MDYLLIALVQHYHQAAAAGPPAAAALAEVGHRTGRLLAERFTRTRPPITDPLDAMKWVCKELWPEVFKKGIDNLRTNHRGTFVLRDTQFRWTLRLSQNLVAGAERIGAAELAAEHLVLPCALVRGALAGLGLEATVTADATTLPQVDFTVVVTGGSGGVGSGGAGQGGGGGAPGQPGPRP
jgi:hypothetical protein